MRPVHLEKLLRREIASLSERSHTPVMLWGPPGVGKSQIVAKVAGDDHLPLIDIRLSQLEPSDLRGIPFRVDERVEWAIPSMLPDQDRHGSQGRGKVHGGAEKERPLAGVRQTRLAG